MNDQGFDWIDRIWFVALLLTILVGIRSSTDAIVADLAAIKAAVGVYEVEK
jgi:hypothetical protein